MDYEEIVALSLSYADREDEEVTSRMPGFIQIMEARTNRKLRVFDMSVRAILPMIDNEVYYGLPSDFGGLRDIQFTGSDGGTRQTLTYLNPEQMNNLERASSQSVAGRKAYYTLIARQIQIYPPQVEGISMEVVYYQKVPGLTSTNSLNWLAETNPDVYIYGILVEISAYVKDKDTSKLWNDRFEGALAELEDEDAKLRWSGTPMEIKIG